MGIHIFKPGGCYFVIKLKNHTSELVALLNKLNKSMTYSNISFNIILWIFEQQFTVFLKD
ncbi:MAG: hypothetical protein COT09_05730 [Candidatus Hydromicrobium americanum]|nr:MAG: hypothetical protein COT09_05730 [Candidatus Hydromicrobium americanum]